MLDVRVHVDVESLRGVRQSLRDDAHKLRLGIAMAINDTAKHAKSFISRAIRQHVPIRKRTLDRKISKTHAETGKLEAIVTVKDAGPLPLRVFSAKQGRSGVTVLLDKQGGRTPVTEALDRKGNRIQVSNSFIVKSLAGNVFTRTSAKRTPIAKLFGPSPVQIYEQSGAPQLTQEDAGKFLEKRLDYRLGRVMEGTA